MGGVGRTSTAVVIPGGPADTIEHAGARALASVGVVDLANGTGRHVKVAGCHVVVQATRVGGVGGTRASHGVPGGPAQAGADLFALALAARGVHEVRGHANGLVDALAGALGVQFLVAGALVGAVAGAGGGVVDVVGVGAGGVHADLGGGAKL